MIVASLPDTNIDILNHILYKYAPAVPDGDVFMQLDFEPIKIKYAIMESSDNIYEDMVDRLLAYQVKPCANADNKVVYINFTPEYAVRELHFDAVSKTIMFCDSQTAGVGSACQNVINIKEVIEHILKQYPL